MDLLSKMVELDNMFFQDEDELASINQKFDKLIRSYFEMPENNTDTIIPNISILLKHTDENNNFWPIYTELYDNPLFFQSFAKNINNLKSGYYLEKLFSDICKFSGTTKVFDYDEVLEYLVKDKYTEIVWIKYIDMMDSNQKIRFLNLIRKERINIDFILANCFNLQELLTREAIEDYIISNIDDFIKQSSNIFTLKEYFKNLPNILIRINKYIDSNHLIISKSIINSIKKLEYPKNNQENFEVVLSMLIDELVSNEQINYSDIEINMTGSTSIVIMIKDKVLKISKGRKCESFPNNPYIIKPLLRRKFIFQDEEFFVEITEKAKTSNKINQEDLYHLYKGFRELGLVWTDISKNNVGYLKRDNIIHWHEELNPSDEVLNFEPSQGNIILKKGDLVVIDADYIYKEEDIKDILNIDNPDFVISLPFLAQIFETRYQEEQKKLNLK